MTRILIVSAMFALSLSGCSNDTAAVVHPVCDELAEKCHPYDTGSGAAHDCHEFAETPSSTDSQCEAMFETCDMVCRAADDGGTDAGTDAGETDAGTDAAAAAQ